MKLRSLAGALAILAVMPHSFAHEGHGHPEHPQGILHYVMNPTHALPVVLCLTGIMLAAWTGQRTLRRRSRDNQSR